MEDTKSSIDELFALPKQEFIDLCLAWSKECDDGKKMNVKDDPSKCPLHQWVVHNWKGCGKGCMANTSVCPVCGEMCCVGCFGHDVEILSRVTGYIGNVSAWNSGKQQEFMDRQRTDVKSFS